MKKFKKSALMLIWGLLLASCTETSNGTESVSLYNVLPTQASPGETIILSGTEFVTGMQICFGTGMNMCTVVNVTSPSTGTAVVPAGSGSGLPISVVLPDGTSHNSSVLFSYENTGNVNGNQPGNGSGYNWQQTEHEIISDTPRIDRITPTGGVAGTSVTIAGANLGSASGVCFGESCVNVTPASDRIVVNAPAGSGNVMVRVTGPDWSIKAGQFSYIETSTQSGEIESIKLVEWCRLNYAPSTAQLGEMTTSYAEVFKDGCTPDSSSRCPEMKAQIGYIADNASTKQDPSTWTWTDAHQNTLFSHDNGNVNDEYMGDLSTLGEGTYRVAFRYSMDGTNWLYCDYDSSTNGFSADQSGLLTVSAQKPLNIEWCRIVNGNTNISSSVNAESEAVYAQFFVSNDCTKDRTQCPNLKAQIGYGPFNLFSTNELNNNFTWKDAAFNSMYDGSGGKDHNEYMGTVSASSEGNYAVLFRGSVDGGNTWTYCDTSDNNTFSANDAVSWTVGNGNNNNGNPLQVTETFGDFYFHLIPERDYECGLARRFHIDEYYYKNYLPYENSFLIQLKDSNMEIDKVQYCRDDINPYTYTIKQFFEKFFDNDGKCKMLWTRRQALSLYKYCTNIGGYVQNHTKEECMYDDNYHCDENPEGDNDCGHGSKVEFVHSNILTPDYIHHYTYIFTLTDGRTGYCYYEDSERTYYPGIVVPYKYRYYYND